MTLVRVTKVLKLTVLEFWKVQTWLKLLLWIKLANGEVQYQRVNVDVKVMEIGDITVLDDGRRVQNVVVADATGTVELALWQDFIGKLIIDKSYKLKNVMVKCFGNSYM